MEALISIVGFIIVVGGIVAVAYYYTYVAEPRKRTPQIIAALEENERIGLSDIDVDIRRTAARWGLLKIGHTEAKRFKTEAYSDRIAAQMKVLEPRAADLLRERTKLTNLETFLNIDTSI
ncbi:hypothetical protein [Arthrobacter sp. Leaf69]|uniref:hypothetical protein n=1 Tax=Arthrobacter sp. Leaf69 TaxID=1736232 RepID=UPI0006F87843|nr:hypothetical protein [Arthrobacter sp. Leaf69]KQN87216.1 hypothetical protein ASE96_11045 [Arthrobacter sp. Leaf69]